MAATFRPSAGHPHPPAPGELATNATTPEEGVAAGAEGGERKCRSDGPGFRAMRQIFDAPRSPLDLARSRASPPPRAFPHPHIARFARNGLAGPRNGASALRALVAVAEQRPRGPHGRAPTRGEHPHPRAEVAAGSRACLGTRVCPLPPRQCLDPASPAAPREGGDAKRPVALHDCCRSPPAPLLAPPRSTGGLPRSSSADQLVRSREDLQ